MIRRNQNWVVLRHAHDNVWVQVTAISAPTAKAAVLEVTKGTYSYGSYKAIPAKVWSREIQLG